jgi:hypothetical protein
MKNLFFSSIYGLLFSISVNAQESLIIQTGSIKIKAGEVTSIFKVTSIEELESITTNILGESFEDDKNNWLDNKCEITLEMSLTASKGINCYTISGSVSSSCTTIVEEATVFQKKLVQALY